MNRLLPAAAALLCACGPSMFAQTPVTGNGVKIGGATVTHGTISLWIADDATGQPVPFVNSAGAQKASAFTASITSGVVTNGLTVQDLCLASPVKAGASLSYTAYLYNSDTQTGGTLSGIRNVCGSSAFALDPYFSGVGVTPAVTGMLSGTTAQMPTSCVGASIYIDQTLNMVKPCSGGFFVTPPSAASPGVAPTLAIGTVTQGAAAASITGSNGAYTLNLVLPQGNAGANGSTPAFSIGTVTTGAAGSQASVTVTGTALAPVLNFTIPQGAQGTPGSGGGGGTALALKVNGTANGSQSVLNLKSGQGVVLSDDGAGSITIAYVPGAYTYTQLQALSLPAYTLVVQTDAVVGATGTAGGGTMRRLLFSNGPGNGYIPADDFAKEKNVAGGIAGLDSNALINAAQLPSTLTAGPTKYTSTTYPGQGDYTSSTNNQSSQNPAVTSSYGFVDANVPSNMTGYGFAHGFTDNNTYNRTDCASVSLGAFNGGTAGRCAYASYDARTSMRGSNNYNHIVNFQGANEVNLGSNSNIVNQWAALLSNPRIVMGIVENAIGVHVTEASVAAGAGLLNHFGVFVDPLTKATGTNWGVYVKANPSYFGGGSVITGAINGVTVNGSTLIQDEVTASNTRFLSVGADANTIGTHQFCTSKLGYGSYGCVKVTDGTVQLANSTTSQTCSATTRGTFNYVAAGSGAKDTVQVCAKDSSDAYAWRAIF